MQGDADFWDAHRKSARLPTPKTTKHGFSELVGTNKKINVSSVDVVQATTLDAVSIYKSRFPGSSIAIHNFANGFAPCAHNVTGNTQEEYLFRRTNLSRTLVDAFYPLKCDSLLSTRVNILDTYTNIDVITSAALDSPVLYHDTWYNGDYLYTEKVLSTTLLLSNTYDIFITGAWGCGLFANPKKDVCELWNKLIPVYGGANIVFAIPDTATYTFFKQYIAI